MAHAQQIAGTEGARQLQALHGKAEAFMQTLTPNEAELFAALFCRKAEGDVQGYMEAPSEDVQGYVYLSPSGSIGVYTKSIFGTYGTPPPPGSVTLTAGWQPIGYVTSLGRKR